VTFTTEDNVEDEYNLLPSGVPETDALCTEYKKCRNWYEGEEVAVCKPIPKFK
jgi:hypothetical protein